MTNHGVGALYLQVARTLQDRIASGELPVGCLLPTEHMLAEQFGVSRQTVRQAIGHLRSMKLLSARKGVGTRVESSRPQTAYYHALQSLSDLFQFASDALYHVTKVDRVTVAGREAEELGCRPGRIWLRLEGLRKVPGVDAPVSQTIVMIDGRYGAVAATPRVHTRAIFAQIEERFGITITEVHQDIEATVLTAAQAEMLQSEPGSPALLITRRFFGAGHSLVLMSRNLHASSRFRYSMTVRRDA
jgi:GntR family transcriptional regulator